MKKSLLACIFECLLLIVFMVQIAAALPLYRVTDPYSLPSGFNGGPFLVDPLPVGGTNTFLTFCIERNEYFSPGSSYYGSIEDAAIFGGVGGQVTPGRDPVDVRTKVLYGYYLDHYSTFTVDMYTGMQLAIWKIENEITDFSGYSTNIQTWANDFYNNYSSGTPKYDIMALNLWDYNYAPGQTYEEAHKIQSMLVRVPEPGILILLGIALSAVGLASRRRKS